MKYRYFVNSAVIIKIVIPVKINHCWINLPMNWFYLFKNWCIETILSFRIGFVIITYYQSELKYNTVIIISMFTGINRLHVRQCDVFTCVCVTMLHTQRFDKLFMPYCRPWIHTVVREDNLIKLNLWQQYKSITLGNAHA